MTVRVAFLRGINVGKAHRVPMAELRALATGLGLTDVATHLQSGNLLHSSEADPEADRLRLAAALEEAFGFTVDVVVVESDRLADLVAAHPFADGDPKRVHLGFAPGALPHGLRDELEALAREGERFEVRDDVLFADFGQGVHDSRAGNALARLVRPGFVTLRNLATVGALVERSR